MPVVQIKSEREGYSHWFRWTLCAASLIYVVLWLFTLHLHTLQLARDIHPALPALEEDSSEYVSLTESLMQGQGFAQYGQFETLRTPGYPVFIIPIKTVFGSYFAVTFVQIFITLLSTVVIRRIGMRFMSKKVGEVAATLFLLNPVTVTLTLLIYSDILFLLLFTTGFYLAVSLEEKGFLKQVLLLSLLFACAIYVRPIGLLAIPIFIAPIVTSHLTPALKAKAIGTLLACLVLAVSPWMTRNYLHTGVFSFTSIEASSLSWTTLRFMANTNRSSLSDATKALEDIIGTPESSWRDMKMSAQIRQGAMGVILTHPFSYAKFHIVSSLTFLFPSTIAFAVDTYNASLNQAPPFAQGAIRLLASGDITAFYENVMHVWWKVTERIWWLGVSIIALLAFWQRRNDPIAYTFVFVVGYLMLLAGPAAGPRYSLQAWPFLLILFVAGCVELQTRFAQRYLRASK